MNAAETRRRRLIRLVALSIAAAIATIALKTTAWLLTGSVGLLSDAAESVVNLVAAVVAMLALRRPCSRKDVLSGVRAAGVEGSCDGGFAGAGAHPCR